MADESRAEAAGERSTYLVAVLASLWLGAAILFAAVVAPAAFAVLPSRTMAGALAGRILPMIFVLGIVLGLAVAFLELRPPHTRRWLARTVGGVLVAVACAVAQLGVAPRIHRIREVAGTAIDSLPAGDSLRVDFGRLHAVSVGWLAVAMLAAASIILFGWLGVRRAGAVGNTEPT